MFLAMFGLCWWYVCVVLGVIEALFGKTLIIKVMDRVKGPALTCFFFATKKSFLCFIMGNVSAKLYVLDC